MCVICSTNEKLKFRTMLSSDIIVLNSPLQVLYLSSVSLHSSAPIGGKPHMNVNTTVVSISLSPLTIKTIMACLNVISQQQVRDLFIFASKPASLSSTYVVHGVGLLNVCLQYRFTPLFKAKSDGDGEDQDLSRLWDMDDIRNAKKWYLETSKFRLQTFQK